MRTRAPAIVLLAVVATAGLAGCGLGAGKSSKDVSLLITRDFGGQTLGQKPAAPTAGSETVMRYLQRSFDVRTRFGGGFVQSIDGLAGGREGTRPVDWFFYVNGIQSGKGAASVTVHPGDRVWWDRHDWSATQTVPAVVGSYPEPFVHGSGGKRLPVRVECAKDADKSSCRALARKLGEEAGVVAGQSLIGTEGGDDQLRVVVGPWSAVRASDRIAPAIEAGPRESGVYARLGSDGRALALLDAAGRTVRTLGAGAGLIAATRYEDQPPTWLVTGTDDAGVAAAVRAFSAATLTGRFAVALPGPAQPPVALPLPSAR